MLKLVAAAARAQDVALVTHRAAAALATTPLLPRDAARNTSSRLRKGFMRACLSKLSKSVTRNRDDNK